MLDACARKKARHDECVPVGRAGDLPQAAPCGPTSPKPECRDPGARRRSVCIPSAGSRRRDVGSPCGASARAAGRPGLRCEYVQRRAMSWRCQRRSVSGLIGKTVQAGRASERLSDTSSARSARVSLGRDICRRRIASSCPRTRISISFERRDRPSSHTSANRFRTTRSTNDQSKQPSLDHDKSDEPSEPDAQESRGGVCDPYACLPRFGVRLPPRYRPQIVP
jgi:hypothetical protein